MPLENPLNNLKDIQLPPEVSIWPPAPGWWILLMVIFLLFVFFFKWIKKIIERQKPKTEAILLLNNLQNHQNNSEDALLILRELSKLLRRVALTFCPEENIASLHGVAWLEFLDRTGKTTEFTRGEGHVFGVELFQQNPEIKIDVLFPLVKKWIIECNQRYLKNH